MVKPHDFNKLRALMKIFYDFWMACEVPEVDITGKRIKTKSRGKLGERFPQKE